ncbi:MAG: sigma-70 family RNA polymerase sigma factor [Planctomycetota bacterium]|nr:sigma-70 family RNA polymerase sigma factor [Planctomycetota bacterium]
MPDRPLDPDTVADCHSAFSKMLERYAWAIVRDWSLAADVVQASFVALARFGADVAPEARKSWLFRVAHREALRVRECQKPYNQASSLASAGVFETQATYEVNPLAKMADQEEAEGLRDRINRLSVEQRQVLRLRFFENKTFAEIAEALQIPLGTALSRMRLALERLRSMSNETKNEKS